MQALSEQELLRRQKRDELAKLGVDPYPAEEFDVTAHAADILANYERLKTDYKDVALAGRIMSFRIMGNASFFELQDSTGRLQAYVRRDDICPTDDKTLYNTVFKRLLDIGDFVGIKGFVFTTQTGEITVHVQELKVLAKALRPLPVVKHATDESGQEVTYDGFTDAEQRYRQRYVDLVVNPDVREVFVKRAQLINSMRNLLAERGYLEVETPILQPIHGGAAARPFKTHHNTLDMPLYLRIANELYLKRLIVGGFEGVFEFAKDFRNEGMSRFHNPEFTLMELYVAYKDYHWMMNLTEEMIEKVALDLHGDTKVQVGPHLIDFKRPWQRYTMAEAIQHFTGFDITGKTEAELAAAAQQMGVATDSSMGLAKIIDEIFGAKVEANLIQPTFITDYPIEMSPLTKKHRSKPGLVERFEAICNAKEIANAYSELNDPVDQRERFEDQLRLAERGDQEAMAMDEDFLRALEYGMPPTAGIGIGIDRLAMIMTNQASIQDVLFFPQMRPEARTEAPTATAADFVALGVREELIPIIQKLGYLTPEALRQVPAGKLLNDIGGMRKKLKLNDVKPATKDEIDAWLA
ncbi:MAG: lysine--tRNA ligase [Bernardetiaceae bacterium]|jgi:lysyl-tRNA synthetase class 2|nr:lysine--tRNA ligase [Bernardetiaceae bacterium]